MSSSSSISGCLCRGEISPKIFQTFGTTKESCKVSRVDQQNVACAVTLWFHPQQAVHLRITGRGKWMRSVRVDRLFGEYVYPFFAAINNFIMRQVRMKIQRGHVFQKPEFIQ